MFAKGLGYSHRFERIPKTGPLARNFYLLVMDPSLILYIILLVFTVIVGIVDICLVINKMPTITDLCNSYIEIKILVIMIHNLFPLLIQIHLSK